MKIIEPYYEIVSEIDGEKILKEIELIGRVCYKSEDHITTDSSNRFISKIISSGHESVIEHSRVSVRIVCDRGVSHEIVRHRIASYSQESTRYCNYFDQKFGSELILIRPFFWNHDKEKYVIWEKTMIAIEKAYNSLIAGGAKPEEARCLLPNSLKTEIVVSMNLREWRHFFKLRTAKNAHPQMRQVVIPLLKEMKERICVIFDDISADW